MNSPIRWPFLASITGHVCRLTPLAVVAALSALIVAVPVPARAQGDKWEVDVAPLYFWASALDGRIVMPAREVSLFLPFDEAADTLAGAFSFHGEARKGRWGMLADINFLRLSTDADFRTATGAVVPGTAELDLTIFEGGVSYLVNPDRNLSVLGGIRTYNLSPRVELDAPVQGVREVDVSRTAVSAFGGVAFRPKINSKLGLLTRADIGGGEAFTWSGTIGLEYRFKPWGGLAFGYHALGVDTGDAEGVFATPASGEVAEPKYDVTHYGPFFSLTLHWAQK
jgi:hypothetical protein